MIEIATPEDRMAAAGEYVLGTLADEDRDAFVAAMTRDDALLAEVYAWQDRLLGLSRHVPPATASPRIWRRIDASLEATSNESSNTAVGAPPAPVRPVVRAPRVRWWERVAAWQAIGGVALAASLVMAVVLVQRTGWPGASNDRYLALLQSPQDQTTGWVVEIEANRRLRLVPVAGAAAAPAGKSLQFWTKPQGAAGPTSLGLVRSGQTVELPVSQLPGVGEQQLFEITLEPENGSPIGRPTGPILYVGRTVHL